MSQPIIAQPSRRSFLQMLGLAAAAPLVPGLPRAALASPALSLAVVKRTLDINGKPARVFGIVQPNGTSGLVLPAGQRFALDLQNQTDEPTIVHWHGQTPPYEQDGVMDARRPLLAAGATRSYDYAPRPGTHWMHSHHGLQEQLLLAAPLIVHGKADEAADRQEVVVLLHDFTFRDPAEVLQTLQQAQGGHAAHDMAMDDGDVMAMTPAERTEHQQMLRDMMADGGMDVNDVDYDAYLANDRTLRDPQIVPVEPGGRILLRVINGATSTGFQLTLGALTGTLVAVDGEPVMPVKGDRFGLTMGQRLDIMLTLPRDKKAWPVLARREGAREQTGIILAPPGAPIAKLPEQAAKSAPLLDLALERKLCAVTALADKPVAVTHQLVLTGSMAGYHWSINGKPHGDQQPFAVQAGQRVALEFQNLTMMAHPMHLHGHPFQVTSIDGHALAGAVRDTVLVPVGSTVRVVFDADNPGRWPLHCHNLLHMARGMMTEIEYT